MFQGTNGGTGRESGGTNNQTIPPVTNQPPPPAVHVPNMSYNLKNMMCILTAVEEENEQSRAYDTLDPTLDHLINTITCLRSLPVYHLIEGMTMPLISNLGGTS